MITEMKFFFFLSGMVVGLFTALVLMYLVFKAHYNDYDYDETNVQRSKKQTSRPKPPFQLFQ